MQATPVGMVINTLGDMIRGSCPYLYPLASKNEYFQRVFSHQKYLRAVAIARRLPITSEIFEK
jgi:hypothetical protein